jgi:sulfate permease, SulP family
MMFRPKLFETLKTYTSKQFGKDILAGVIVGIVALPLAIAFAIASGVSPEKGLYTAVIAGFFISVMGGSKVQIGGPTGAFIVIVYGIVMKYGVNGLIIATFMAGIMLIIMGFARLGSVIKFIPYPLITGFTSGIAVIIFSSQMKDFFGLKMGMVPADFLSKWTGYFQHLKFIDIPALFISITTIFIIVFWPKITRKIPGSLIAIIASTAFVCWFKAPVETIGSKFGVISSSFPNAVLHHLDLATIKALFQPAFTIALLCAIESLLSAVIADGMIGGNHKSNMELVAQGTANVFSAIFGGIPATGAIARTVTNIKNGGRTPVAGIVHALTLFLIIIFFGKWASLIPMATLAGILVVVAYNMSEWESFLSILKGPRTDTVIMLSTFLLTVLIDLTVAIETGMVLAAFLFMRNMIKFSNVRLLNEAMDDSDEKADADSVSKYFIPKNVDVYEITGPLFFGAVYKFKDAMKYIEKAPKFLIIRMRKVSLIDGTGIKALTDVYRDSKKHGIKLILAEVDSLQVMEELNKSILMFSIGKDNVTQTFAEAIERCGPVLASDEVRARMTME